MNDTRLSIIPEVLPHIPFVGWYDQRILPILKNTTAIFSNPFEKSTHEYYHSLWLSSNVEIIQIDNIPEKSLTEMVLSNPNLLDTLKRREFKTLINFTIDIRVENLAQSIWAKTLVNSKISEIANNKLKLKKFLQKVSLPVVEWIYTNNADTIRKYFSEQEHYFFKDPLGVSGYGFWSNQKNSLEEILTWYGGKDIIIEKVIEKDSSPSIQFCIYGKSEKKAVIFGFTDQILEWWQHYIWNQSPSQYLANKEITHEFIRQSEIIIWYLIEVGYIWFGGIDFMVSKSKEIFATEVNARFTGATYPAISSLLLTQSLITPWRYTTQEWVTQSADDYLRIAIQKSGEYGLFPICIAPLEQYGRAQVLFLGELDEHDL